MRVKPAAPARVVWEEGMFLAPHHFQAQRRHFEEGVARVLDALFPFAWGVATVAVDAEALANGMLALAQASGVFPDGTPFHLPEADLPPPPVALDEHFSPAADAHTVYLVLPAWRRDAPNVDGADADAEVAPRLLGADAFGAAPHANGGAPAPPRYVAVVRTVVDEASGRDASPIRFAAKNLRLVLEGAVPDGGVALPVARVRRDAAGRFAVDADYVPPCLTFAASDRLVALLRGLVGMLEAKGAALAATLAPVPAAGGPAAGPSAYVGNEVATRWMLHAVRSAEAPLRHLAAVGHAHPERLWTEVARLAGALCTFALGVEPRDLPAYAHDDLAGCFGALERHVRAQLDAVVAPSAVVVPLARATPVLHSGAVEDRRCFEPGARWFVGVTAAMPAAEVAARVPALVKACASKYVLELVRRAYPGLTVAHVPAPPAGLAPRPGVTYFELTLAGPCAQALRDTREFGVYVPDGVPDAHLELAVLVPS
jgi:type VI secretion system protein ImpJ